MNKYFRYKDSTIEWLGQIPEHWEVKKLNYVCMYQIGGTPPTGNSDSFYGENKWLNISDIGDGKYIFDTEKRISDNAIKDNNISISPKGGLLFSFKLSIGQVCFVGTELYTNEAVATFLPSSKINLDYAYYMFPICVVKNAKQNIYGADLLNQELIASAKICYPPLTEQQQIADFLDQQTAKIDNLVQKQNKLIELLQEKKKSLINHVVTKGLNPDVQMKDSGIEWLGQIPEHWGLFPNKYIMNISKEVVGNKWSSYRLLSLTLSGIIERNIEENFGKFPAEFDGYQVVKINDFIFCLFDVEETPRTVGLFSFDGMITSAYTVVKLQLNLAHKYYYYLFLNIDNFKSMKLLYTGLRNTIQKEVFMSTKSPVPPLTEQQQIADFLDQQTAKIDALVNKAKSMVDLLKEHKQSLINNVVTGKIKVINEEMAL